jgi:hypothetical protein
MSYIALEQLTYALPRLQDAIPDFTVQTLDVTSTDNYYTDGSSWGSMIKLHFTPKGGTFPAACIYIWADGNTWVSFSSSPISASMPKFNHWLLSLRGLA